MSLFLIILSVFNFSIEKLKTGNPAEFEKLFKAYKLAVYNYLLVKTRGNREVTEDVLSETFYSAFKSASRITNLQNIQGWLLRIAFRRLNDYLKNEYKQRDKIEKLKNKLLQNSTEKKEKITDDEKIVLFKLALDNMKEDYKYIIELKYIHKKSQKEIADELHKTCSAVEALLFRARKALKKEMKQLVKKYM